MKFPGLFVVFEGIDGSGKTTLTESLLEKLTNSSIPVQLCRQPTKYETGQFLRRFLSGEIQLTESEAQKAFLEDRKVSVDRDLLPALEKGEVVLLDRYYYSTAAYQASPQNPPDAILAENQRQGFPSPDLLFFLDLDPKVALSRLKARKGPKEKYDRLPVLKNIDRNYRNILPSQCIHLDATLSPEKLMSLALSIIMQEYSNSKA